MRIRNKAVQYEECTPQTEWVEDLGVLWIVEWMDFGRHIALILGKGSMGVLYRIHGGGGDENVQTLLLQFALVRSTPEVGKLIWNSNSRSISNRQNQFTCNHYHPILFVDDLSIYLRSRNPMRARILQTTINNSTPWFSYLPIQI